MKKELKRGQVASFFAKLDPCRIGLEACASAHHWARQLKALGHDARLIPAQRVKAFLPRQKNDAADAQAIARAVKEPEMRFVAVKTGDAMRAALRPLVAALFALAGEIAGLDKAILKVHRESAVSQRLATVPGIGTLTATVLSATVGDPASFGGGREFAAWIGLVPRQHSTGGKARLGHISKMGNRDLRRLLVVGAHAALYRIKSGKTQSALADWARKLLDKKPFKLVAVALANKMARIAWAIMAGDDCYNPKHAAAA